MKPTRGQLPMFADCTDLPLWSGTASRATAQEFTPRETVTQPSMFSCPVCHDTGRVGNKACWCTTTNRLPKF
jgi:hypothetical protein